MRVIRTLLVVSLVFLAGCSDTRQKVDGDGHALRLPARPVARSKQAGKPGDRIVQNKPASTAGQLPETATDTSGKVASQPWPAIRLLGFVNVGEPMALLQVGPKTLTARAGDQLPGAIFVDSIQPPHVVLTDNTVQRTIQPTQADRKSSAGEIDRTEVLLAPETQPSEPGQSLIPLPPLPADISEPELRQLEQAHLSLPLIELNP